MRRSWTLILGFSIALGCGRSDEGSGDSNETGDGSSDSEDDSSAGDGDSSSGDGSGGDDGSGEDDGSGDDGGSGTGGPLYGGATPRMPSMPKQSYRAVRLSQPRCWYNLSVISAVPQ